MLENFLLLGKGSGSSLLLVALPLIVGGIVVWAALVRSCRWDYFNAIHRKYGPKWDNGRGKITPEEAQAVVHISSYYDMPIIMYLSLSFALFKTYGIPSISKILIATKQLSSAAFISRRYSDTGILISTFHSCPISGFRDPEFSAANRLNEKNQKAAEDPRAMIALARVNWLHSHYNISNEDYLYTLSLFIMEPAVWARKYGWRKLSPMEEHCFFVYWSEIGRRMNIKNIPGTLEELQTWSKQYEMSHMVPAKSNHLTARHTLDELLARAPKAFGIKKFGEKLAICLLDDIVRKAMMFPRQPSFYRTTINLIMTFAALIQTWFVFPRRAPKFNVDTSIITDTETRNSCPRLHPRRFAAKPWYRPEATGLGYYRDQLLVAIGYFSEMPGPHLKSAGYRLEELGPTKFENSGHEEVMEQAAKLQGCPIVGPWSKKQTMEA